MCVFVAETSEREEVPEHESSIYTGNMKTSLPVRDASPVAQDRPRGRPGVAGVASVAVQGVGRLRLFVVATQVEDWGRGEKTHPLLA